MGSFKGQEEVTEKWLRVKLPVNLYNLLMEIDKSSGKVTQPSAARGLRKLLTTVATYKENKFKDPTLAKAYNILPKEQPLPYKIYVQLLVKELNITEKQATTILSSLGAQGYFHNTDKGFILRQTPISAPGWLNYI